MINKERLLAATLTLSDLAAAGRREDTSGLLLRELMIRSGFDLLEHRVLPDDRDVIEKELLALAQKADVVITTGGTGISPRDVTPEATLAVVEKRIPGIEEALHRSGGNKVPTAILSRAVAGVRGQCLIVNLPGSPGGVRDGMSVLAPVLHHAVHLLRGQVRDCAADLVDKPDDSGEETFS